MKKVKNPVISRRTFWEHRVVRSEVWSQVAKHLRSGYRYGVAQDYAFGIGIRICLKRK